MIRKERAGGKNTPNSEPDEEEEPILAGVLVANSSTSTFRWRQETQTTTMIAGISGAMPPGMVAEPVIIDEDG